MHFASNTDPLIISKEVEGRTEVGKNEAVNNRKLNSHQELSLVNYLMSYISCDFDKRSFDYTINLCPFESKVLGIEVDYISTYVFKVK